MLPGTKVKGGESPHLALQRLLDKEFASLSAHVVIDKLEVVSEDRPSHEFGIETRYVRFIFNATLSTEFEPLVITVGRTQGVATRPRFSTRVSSQIKHRVSWWQSLP